MKRKFKPRCPPKRLSTPVKPGKPSLSLCQRYTPKIGLRLGMEPSGPPNPNPPDPPVTVQSVFTMPDGLTVFTAPDDTTVFTTS